MTQEDPRRRHDPNRSSPAANAAHVARSARAKVTPSPQYRTERAAAVAAAVRQQPRRPTVRRGCGLRLLLLLWTHRDGLGTVR